MLSVSVCTHYGVLLSGRNPARGSAASGSGQHLRPDSAAGGIEDGNCETGAGEGGWKFSDRNLSASVRPRGGRGDGVVGRAWRNDYSDSPCDCSGHDSGSGICGTNHTELFQKKTEQLCGSGNGTGGGTMTALLNDFLSLSAVWGVLLTLAAFGLGALINRLTGKAFFNPLLLGSIFVIILLSVLKIPYSDYKESSAPVSYLLLPATISLAIPLYEKWDLLKENAAAIIAGISVGTFVSLGSALALALVFDLSHEQYVTILPKSVTTAISMDVAGELGGITALTGAIVILTGIAGNLLAEAVCKWFHITDPIAKGVGIGTSAHAVGTSKALQMGEVEGAMSGLSIAVAGILTAVLCPLFAQLLA